MPPSSRHETLSVPSARNRSSRDAVGARCPHQSVTRRSRCHVAASVRHETLPLPGARINQRRDAVGAMRPHQSVMRRCRCHVPASIRHVTLSVPSALISSPGDAVEAEWGIRSSLRNVSFWSTSSVIYVSLPRDHLVLLLAIVCRQCLGVYRNCISKNLYVSTPSWLRKVFIDFPFNGVPESTYFCTKNIT